MLAKRVRMLPAFPTDESCQGDLDFCVLGHDHRPLTLLEALSLVLIFLILQDLQDRRWRSLVPLKHWHKHFCILWGKERHKFSPDSFCLRFYLFIHERHREKEAETGRGRSRSRLHAGTLMWNLILGLQDHALGRRQALNH